MSRVSPVAHPVHDLIAKRWSPYAFADKPVSTEDLKSLFEAAAWAASSYNEQPWRYIVATKDDPKAFEKLLSCLAEANQAWARHVPVLALSVMRTSFTMNGKPNRVALHDVGAASASLTLEATNRGLVVHQMAGIQPDKVRVGYGLPEEFEPVAGLAIGYVGDSNTLPDELRKRDTAPRERRGLAEFVFEGKWGKPSSVVAS